MKKSIQTYGRWGFICMLALILLVTTACSASTSGEVKKTEDGRVVVDLWYALGGTAGEAVVDMVQAFNESQDKYYVEAAFQGSYEESLTQLRQVGGTAQAPALVQVFEVGTKYMIESGFIEPMHTFIERDQFDLSGFEQNILGYYQVDGKLYSMPFNSSNPIMFYNKELFREAGLDPENPPKTYSEVREAAKVIGDHFGGKVDGFSVVTHGWFTEQMIANQGALYVNNENGRGGEPTESLIHHEAGQNWFGWLAAMKQDGTLGNYGRNWDDHRAAFKARTVAIYLDSSASTAGNVMEAEFEVGTAFLPVPDGMEPQGVIVGGAALWMMKGIAEETQEAAWEFIKFSARPDVQAKWAASTGYFPITKAAHEEPVLQEIYAKHPQFVTAVKQLQNTTLTPATQGALMGVFPEVREHVVNAIESLHDGADPMKALEKVQEEINRELENDRRTKK